MTASEVEIGTIPVTEASTPEEPPIESGYVTYEKDLPQVESAPARRKLPLVAVVGILAVGLMAAAGVAMSFAKKPTAAPTFQDLGAGISNATGLKASLQVRWQNSAQYQINFKPIDPLQSAGFSYVAANPQPPMSITMRILDATGFALCNKEIDFPSPNGAKAGSPDVFQNTLGADGKVTEFNAQGLLPCSADQFRQASYWDFSTNFPTLAEQDALMNQSANEKAKKEALARAAERRNSGMGFTAEGYDGATGYDSSRNTLETRLGRDFLVTRASDRTAASTWAATASLFHYKCDQRSRCTLTHAGGGQSIYVMAMQ